jgi:hypothetical protein
VPDLDALLNFLYIVAFLAAMILPSFQRQRREEARKRAEAQRQAQEVPTVEERSPEDVPEPTVRRGAPTEAGERLAEAAPAEPAKVGEPTAKAAEPVSRVEPRPAAAHDHAAASATQVGESDLTDLDEVIDLTALDEAIDVTSLDDGEKREERPTPAPEVRPSFEGSLRVAVTDRTALRQALIFGELLQPPLALRRERSFPPQL